MHLLRTLAFLSPLTTCLLNVTPHYLPPQRHPSLLASSRRSSQVRGHAWPGAAWRPKHFILLFVLVHKGDLHQGEDHHHCLPSWELDPTVYLGHADRVALVDMPGHGGQLPEENAENGCRQKRSHLFKISVHNTGPSTGTSQISDTPFPDYVHTNRSWLRHCGSSWIETLSIPQVDSDVGDLDMKI